MSSSGFLPVTSNTSSAVFLMILAQGRRLVDAVAESHEPAFTGLDTLDEAGNVLQRADLGQHAKHRFVGAAVQRSVEGRRRRHRRIRVDMRAADAAHRVGAAVLLVIGVEDEQHVERALEHRADLILQLGHRNSMFRKLPVKLRSLSG